MNFSLLGSGQPVEAVDHQYQICLKSEEKCEAERAMVENTVKVQPGNKKGLTIDKNTKNREGTRFKRNQGGIPRFRDCLEVRASRLKMRLLIYVFACRMDGGSQLVVGLGREMRDSVLVSLRFRCPRTIQVELPRR